MPHADSAPLVAIALPRPAAARAAVRCWEAGEAVALFDPDAPAPAVRRLLDSVRPTHLVDEQGRHALPGGQPAEPGVAALATTSGTTGRPKAVELTAAGIAASALAVCRALGAGADDRWLACLPLHSVAGLAIVARAWHSGAGLEVHERFEAERVRAADATLVSLVPTMLGRLLDAGVALHRFRAVLLGGGPVPAALRERAAAAGVPLVTTYGLTETFGGVVHDGHPLDGVELEIGAGGQVCVRGAMVMRRYRGDPAGTAAALAGGMLHTGDLGRIGPDGRLVVFGRRDDLIVTGGVNVAPAEVERVLAAHPAVADVAVRGRPDPEWGQRVVAFVVPADPAAPPSLASLRAFALGRLPAAAAPRELVVVDRIPRSGSDKVLRRLLG